jgi:hypothetical protein
VPAPPDAERSGRLPTDPTDPNTDEPDQLDAEPNNRVSQPSGDEPADDYPPERQALFELTIERGTTTTVGPCPCDLCRYGVRPKLSLPRGAA